MPKHRSTHYPHCHKPKPFLVAPSGLFVVDFSGNVELEWVDNSNDEQVFEIHRKTGAGPYDFTALVNANEITFTDTTVDPGTTYSYKVRGIKNFEADGQVFSEFSNEVTTTTDP